MADILNTLNDHRVELERAMELYQAIRTHHDASSVEALIELCAEMLAVEAYSETDIALEVAGQLSVGDDEDTFNLAVGNETVVIRWSGDEGWVELDDDCTHGIGSCEVCTPSNEQDEPA